jgi:hypothetical protein
MHAEPPQPLPRWRTTIVTRRQAWFSGLVHSHLRTVLDDLPMPTDLNVRG